MQFPEFSVLTTNYSTEYGCASSVASLTPSLSQEQMFSMVMHTNFSGTQPWMRVITSTWHRSRLSGAISSELLQVGQFGKIRRSFLLTMRAYVSF